MAERQRRRSGSAVAEKWRSRGREVAEQVTEYQKWRRIGGATMEQQRSSVGAMAELEQYMRVWRPGGFKCKTLLITRSFGLRRCRDLSSRFIL